MSPAWMPDPVNLERPPSPTAWMQVLVKDLCDPDVVATIAKRRFFDITDRPNLTPEIWEKFSDMLNNVQCSQSVDPNDLEAKLRDCPPRSSEPPDTEDRTPSPDPLDVAEEKCKNGAEEAYNTLIEMGGRPTRPIRPVPPWIKVYLHGELCYRYAEPVERIFYDPRWSFTPGPQHYSTEAKYIVGHWGEERARCKEELRRWQDFHDTQRWRREHRPEFAREEDMERQRYPHDPHLTASLKKLKDWKEYQVYFQRRIDRCKRQMEALRRGVEALERKEDPQVVWSKVFTGSCDGEISWLDLMEEELKRLAGEEKRLEWVKKQLPAVLSECAASLMKMPASRREMEKRSELEAKQVYNSLVDTGGRSSRPIRSVPDVYNAEHTDEHLHVLCHWQGECSQFEEELRAWRKFIDYRQKKEADGRTEVQLEERQAAETTTQVDLWKEYRAYQQVEVDNAKQWVQFWQRQVKRYQDKENDSARFDKNQAIRMHSIAEGIKPYIEDARKQVKPAEMRLEWVEQQLSALLGECAVSTTQVSTSDRLEDQPKLPKRSSRSGQPKGLGSDRSGRSALRSNQKPDKNKMRASVNSALGPIHSSKVSKAAGRKTHRSQRPSKIPAEHNDGQNQGLNTTVSPSLPADIAPRRSSRLCNNEQRSGVLKASLAVDLGDSARSPPIVLRRSDRLSKQNEIKSMPTSSAAVNSAVDIQSDPLRRLSRSKPKAPRAGNKSDSNLVKPRGVSKRQRKYLLRKKPKVHD